jgi:conjugal transfer pilus assembly protein TraV
MHRPIHGSILFIAISVCLAGCSSFSKIVNPYENDFSCPDTFHGKCISVTGAYNEALKEKPEEVSSQDWINSCIGGTCKGADDNLTSAKTGKIPVTAIAAEDKNYNAYKDALYRRLDHLLEEPQTPVVAPPKVMRIRFLPYKGQDGEFVMTHDVFFFADEPKWILGNDIEAYDEE